MKIPEVLFTFSYGDEKFNKIEELGYHVTYIPESELTSEDMKKQFEILVCFNPFSKLPLSCFENLKWIQLVSKGINHVPESFKLNPEVIVTNNADTTCIPIAELIISYILQIFKQSKDFFKKQSEKKWVANKDILEIFGKTIGILGTGNIATQTAMRLKAFDAKILGVNSTGHPSDASFDKIYSFNHLTDFWNQCDVIVSTLPATKQTHHLLCEETFSQMKPGVSIINISRGSIISEKDLIERLKTGFFRGVAMDVFEKEPLAKESALWDFDNVIITPHNALYSDLYNERLFSMIYENMVRYKEGTPLLNYANFSKGY